MPVPASSIDPVPSSAWPTFTPVTTPAPAMPPVWEATALLQPFSPTQSNDPNPTTPFFELCVANLLYMEGRYFSAQISGCASGNTWWYIIGPTNTFLSVNSGPWRTVDMGWSLPTNWFGGEASNAVCSGSSPLNWMNAQTVDWWRVPVPNTKPPAATWVWFDSNKGAPIRMMFGDGPAAGPNMGDPTQLAILQMYSFSYFPVFISSNEAAQGGGHPQTVAELQQSAWGTPTIAGFAVGNPNGYQNFVWNGNFGMTAFMTPVNEAFAPLPTRVLYVWKPDSAYAVYSDRAQNTLMNYNYNSGDMVAQEALLTGPAPSGCTPPRDSDTSFLINFCAAQDPICVGPNQGFDFPQEAPDWVSVPAVQGTIQATITNNPVLCPNTTITVFSVLFPPSPPNYPDSTYLWTWYAPQNDTGSESRPVTFMQSQSGVNLGTSLALADYFYYENFAAPIDPANFAIPPQCSPSAPRQAAAVRTRQRALPAGEV
ncbi:MAG: hypothetical protein ACT4QB_19615 [Gammaproteobacteria bacterium]